MVSFDQFRQELLAQELAASGGANHVKTFSEPQALEADRPR
jgi:hypothetical protein